MQHRPDHDQPRFGEFGDGARSTAGGESRLSLLAIGSLITGILALVGCCVPAVGLVPAGLGIGALFAVQRSRGAVAGRGMAMFGLVLGVLALLVSTGLWLGASAVGGKFGPVYSQVLDEDPAVVRTVLTSKAAATLSDEQIAAFRAALRQEHPGEVVIPEGLLSLWTSYGQVGGNPNQYQDLRPASEGPVMPFPAQAGDEWFYLIVLMSPEEQIGSGFPPVPAIQDVGFERADGTIAWLSGVGTPSGTDSQSPPPDPTDEDAGSPSSEAPTGDPGG